MKQVRKSRKALLEAYEAASNLDLSADECLAVEEGLKEVEQAIEKLLQLVRRERGN